MGTSVYLPKTYKGKPITKVADTLFASMRCLSVLIIDSPLEIIPKDFCNGNMGMYKIVLPDTVEVIGYSAFAFCYMLTDIDFPISLKKIEDYAFNSCIRLREFEMPFNLEYIGHNVFYDCKALFTIMCNRKIKFIENIQYDKKIKIKCGANTYAFDYFKKNYFNVDTEGFDEYFQDRIDKY